MNGIGNGYKQVWYCTDDARVQSKLFRYCKDNNLPYRKLGYEAFKVGTYTNFDVWTADEYQTGYRTSNACAVSSALAGIVGFMANILGIEHDVDLDMREGLNGQTTQAEV